MLCRQYRIVSIGNSIEEVLQKLGNASTTLFKWFSDNKMKVDYDKCHFVNASKSAAESKCSKQVGVQEKFLLVNAFSFLK